MQCPLSLKSYKLGNMVKYSKNDILLIQQLKVVAASSTKTVLWNVRVCRISNYGDPCPLGYDLCRCGSLVLTFTFYLNSAQHTVTYSNSRNGECFSIMHTCLALMIVGATLNDGDFGVITFDPWYDSEGPLLQQSQMAWLMSVPYRSQWSPSHSEFTLCFHNILIKRSKKIIEISKYD